MAQVIRDCISFALPWSVIGAENSHRSLNQSDAKLQPFTIWSPAFSRALSSLVVLNTLSDHWLLYLLKFLLSDCCYYFGLEFTILNPKAL